MKGLNQMDYFINHQGIKTIGNCEKQTIEFNKAYKRKVLNMNINQLKAKLANNANNNNEVNIDLKERLKAQLEKKTQLEKINEVNLEKITYVEDLKKMV